MYIDINDLKINYECYGNGKEIIFLHGWGANLQSFSPIIGFLSQNFKVIALDLPGFGLSQAPDTIWGVKEYAEFTNNFLNSLNIKKPILIGHSFGGRIIIHLTGKIKTEAHKIILVDSAGIKPKRSLKYHYKVLLFKTSKIFINALFDKDKALKIIEKARNKHGSDDYKNAPGIMRQIMVKVVNEDLRHLLPKIGAPTLLIWGENDTATPVSDGKIMEKLIPDSGLVILKNAGHYSYLDRLNEFNIILSNFLKQEANT